MCINFRPFSGQPSCAYRGSRELADWLEAEVARRELNIRVERIVCMGHCAKGPNVKVTGGDFIHGADQQKLEVLLEQLAADSP